jgi:hypothetical protein
MMAQVHVADAIVGRIGRAADPRHQFAGVPVVAVFEENRHVGRFVDQVGGDDHRADGEAQARSGSARRTVGQQQQTQRVTADGVGQREHIGHGTGGIPHQAGGLHGQGHRRPRRKIFKNMIKIEMQISCR